MNIVRRLSRSQLSWLMSVSWIAAAVAVVILSVLGYVPVAIGFGMVVYCVLVAAVFWDW